MGNNCSKPIVKWSATLQLAAVSFSNIYSEVFIQCWEMRMMKQKFFYILFWLCVLSVCDEQVTIPVICSIMSTKMVLDNLSKSNTTSELNLCSH